MQSSEKRQHFKLWKTIRFLILFVPATIPLLFGAVHPVVSGAYAALILITCGGWLLLNAQTVFSGATLTPWIYAILLFIAWVIFTAFPLPISFLEILSPVRASYLHAASRLAGMDIRFASVNYHPSAGLMSAIFIFALLLYALSLTALLDSDPKIMQAVLYVCIGLGVLESVYGMLQVFNPQAGVLWLTELNQFKGMARGTIIYKNQYASLLNMCWPLAVGSALLVFQGGAKHNRSPHQQPRGILRFWADKMTSRNLIGFLLLFLASFIMMAVLFSQSRGGTIAMVLVLFLLLLFLPLRKRSKLLLTGCLMLLTTTYGTAVGFSAVIDRFLNIQGQGLARIDLWLSSLPMLYDHLWVGTGLDSYELLSPVYLQFFPERTLFDKAHNEYLELFIELGLPVALLFFTSIFAAFLIQAKRLWAKRKNTMADLDQSELIGLVAICAIAGFLFHGIADFGWHLPANLLYLAILVVFVTHGIRSGT